VADFEYEDNEYILLEGTENSVIANAIFPKVMELSFKPLTNCARVVEFGHAYQQELKNSA
jgi:hypothetical protein